jgi:L-fuconolactonase
MPDRADAHIHLFEHGFRGPSFAARPGVNLDEAACYDSLAQAHHISAALVVGYAAEPWCTDNNNHIAALARQYPWIRPLANAATPAELSIATLQRWRTQGFIGISLYLITADHLEQFATIPPEVWVYLAAHRWLISVNSRGSAWRAWVPILAQFPDLHLLISHLGLPPALAEAPSPEVARQNLQDVLALSQYPSVHVKLSAFYALSTPGYDYPHHAAWPYVQAALDAFTIDRLLWGSDFSPHLDSLSFPQTFSLFAKMPFLSDNDRRKIEGENLLALLRTVAPWT